MHRTEVRNSWAVLRPAENLQVFCLLLSGKYEDSQESQQT